MDALNNVINLIQSVPPDIWALTGLSVLVSAFQQKVNKWFNLESDRVKTVVTGALSLITAGIPALLGFLSANPQALGERTALVFTLTQFAYRFINKPLTNQLQLFKQWKANQNTPETPAAVVTDPLVPATPVVLPSNAALVPKEFQG